MKENETSITFHTDMDLLEMFEKAVEEKEKELGFKLNRRQSMQLAMKEAINKWNPEKK